MPIVFLVLLGHNELLFLASFRRGLSRERIEHRPANILLNHSASALREIGGLKLNYKNAISFLFLLFCSVFSSIPKCEVGERKK